MCYWLTGPFLYARFIALFLTLPVLIPRYRSPGHVSGSQVVILLMVPLKYTPTTVVCCLKVRFFILSYVHVRNFMGVVLPVRKSTVRMSYSVRFVLF